MEVVEVECVNNGTELRMIEKPETRKLLNANMVLLAMGFVHCMHDGITAEFDLEYDSRGNIKVDENFRTSRSKVFAAGDAVTGASLVVKAIYQGRSIAVSVDRYLRNTR